MGNRPALMTHRFGGKGFYSPDDLRCIIAAQSVDSHDLH